MSTAYDAATISFYENEADAYAMFATPSAQIQAFVSCLAPGAKVLELGCGAGRDAEALIAAGLDVIATDGSRNLAALASRRIGRPVRVMRFDELHEVDAFDGVWANACLLHVPADALAGVLANIHRALRDGGIFFASFKAGSGEVRDKLGRYYNFFDEAGLHHCFAAAGPWKSLTTERSVGAGYDGIERVWLSCTAVK